MATCDAEVNVSLAPVLVTFRHNYGRLTCYPANQQAEVLAKIAGTKTLSRETLAGARALGLRVAAIDGHKLADFLAGSCNV